MGSSPASTSLGSSSGGSSDRPPADGEVDLQLLGGGVANRDRILRVGDTVRRPLAPSAPATHALLRHLERAGFDGSPRVLGVTGQTETLTWIRGRAAAAPLPGWALSDATVASVGTLLRRFHDAVASFEPSGHQWHADVPSAYRGRSVSHNDVHPGNIVFDSDAMATGLIDFDLAAPGSAVWDLATAARSWCPLVDDVDLPAGYAAGRDRFRRLAVLLDAYGLARSQRLAVVEAVVANHDWTYRIVTEAARRGHRGFTDYWREVAEQTHRARAWSVRHRGTLLAAVA